MPAWGQRGGLSAGEARGNLRMERAVLGTKMDREEA